MNYTIEEIYFLVGKNDKTALVTFKNGSDPYNKYGESIAVVFVYTQFEREEMDKLLKVLPFTKSGWVKARYLGIDLTPDKTALLLSEGVNSNDIANIHYSIFPEKNTFHSKEKRELNKINIPIRTRRNGQDLDWMYGFKKKLVSQGIGLSPEERAFYLAGKLYYEPENLTKEENEEIYTDEKIKESIEKELLQIKYQRKEISDQENKQLGELIGKQKKQNFAVLDEYLKQAGSSLKKLATENLEQATTLCVKLAMFKERRLNVMGKYPIYMNQDSYLHIYMRHVEEFKINKHFEDKSNFQWNEEDVFNVLGHVIKHVNNEYQKFKEEKPNQRFSKYGKESVYFEGDYYTIHIEPNGRISTFHKNRKEHEEE